MLKEFLKKILKEKGINHLTNIIKKQHPKIYQEIIIQTKYLLKNCKFTERIYHIINNLEKQPKCRQCKLNNTFFHSFNFGYSLHCSPKCRRNDIEVIKKYKQTNLKLYGVDNVAKSKKIQNKKKKTCLKKYGIEYAILSKKAKEKAKQTKKDRYGDENYCNAEKIMQTRMKNGYSPYFSYRGNYEGFHYDSSWELSFIKYCLQNDIKIERNKKGFIYWFEGKKHKYYPDFYLPEVDQYIEIKGYIHNNEKEKEKWNQFPYKLNVYNKEKLINNNILQ
jgi:hypothetical protein